MSAESHLLVHNILFLGGGILNIILVFAVLFTQRKRFDNLTVTFALMTISVAVFQITQVLGSIAPDSDTSRQIFMWNLCVIFIQIFMTHWFFALMGKTKEKRLALSVVYGSGLLLFAIHLIFPYTYLLPSVPKMYLPFYYNPGNLQWLTRTWFHVVGAYYFWQMLLAYRHELDPIRKNRYLFTLIAVLYGFIVGESAVFLVYDVPFDPLWSSFFGLYTFLLAYAVVRYQLLDIRIIVQRTSVYALLLMATVGFIIVANSSSEFLKSIRPDFPLWIVPLVSGVLAVLIGVFFWRKLRENDRLKYEFMTVIAHKFRTPLTQSKWATEELLAEEHSPDAERNLGYIKQSNDKLINLTGALVEMTDPSKTSDSLYHFKFYDLRDLVEETTALVNEAYLRKNIILVKQYPEAKVVTAIDKEKMIFVLQTLLENANAYTPEGGRVQVDVSRTRFKAFISVTDSGIGVGRSDLRYIFTKFYRAHKARLADTEGFGIGLYLSRAIARRHSGNIKVSSLGEGKGSTFTVILPIV